jgi:zinc transport system substrate-binding protein
MKKFYFATLLFCLLLAVSLRSVSEPRVLVSIKPLALIAQDLLGDLVPVETLLPPVADPHHYSLRVSDRRRIEEADLIVWMGPDIERFLVKPLKPLDKSKKIVVANAEGSENTDKKTPHGETSDLHTWLNPEIAIAMSKSLAQHLGELYPDLKPSIDVRLVDRIAALTKLDQQLRQRLARYQGKAFLADHPAYDVLVETYGLIQVESVQKHDDLGLSARHLGYLNQVVTAQQPSCLLVRQGQQNKTLQAWSERWQLPLVSVDIMGSDPTITNYQSLLTTVAAAIEACFDSD